MATSSEEGHLTNNQIVRLATAIEYKKMKSVALGYLGLTFEKVASLSQIHREDFEAFNREIIREWMYQNSGSDQTKVLAGILYKTVQEASYVDPAKVQKILGVPPDEVTPSNDLQEVKEHSEKDFQSITSALRRHYKKTMKIEMAPWLKNYNVPMDKLYTELTLEQIENNSTEPISSKIKGYGDLFTEAKNEKRNDKTAKGTKGIKHSKIPVPSGTFKRCSPREYMGTKKVSYEKPDTKIEERSEGDRVLLKAEPGFGKTTLSRKISWDWAMHIFMTFSIVFFVSLKLVRPGDVIENIIIQQIPHLQGMNITPTKLKKILDTFGHECLIILDGLDELQSRSKPEIVKIIEGQKLFECNVLLTSRPHAVAEFENNFNTVARLQGFTAEHACSLVDKIVTDKKQRREVRKFTRKHRFLHESLHTSPIVLVFICIIAKNEGLDTLTGNITTGDIYLKLIRSLYRKYCVRKGKHFKLCEFRDVLCKVGKLAFRCLLTGNYLFERKEVLTVVGEDAFEYDFLIGHEDFRLLGDETADIFVSFNHYTLQEFLGAFHFLSVINEGTTVGNLLASERTTAPFFMSGLFFHFCLSMLKNAASLLELKEDKSVYQSIKRFTLKLINVHQLDLGGISDTFPSLSFPNAVSLGDKLIMEFLRDIFSSCTNARCLMLGDEDLDPCIIDSLAPLFSRLSEMHCIGRRYGANSHTFDVDPEPDICPESLTIALRYSNRHVLQSFLRYCKSFNRRVSLHVLLFDSDDRLNMLPFLDEPVARLQILNIGRNTCNIYCSPLTKEYPLITHLYLRGLQIESNIPTVLSMAARDSKLPALTHLYFPLCNFIETGSIQQMFQWPWKSLTHLSLRDCFLSNTHEICRQISDQRLLPVLSSLELPFSLARLFFHRLGERRYMRGKNALLTELLVSFNYDEQDDNCQEVETRDFEVIQKVNFSGLYSLTLHRGIRNINHLYMVTKNSVLTRLHKLDISHSSGITGSLSILLCHTFPELKTLILTACGLNSHDICNLVQANAKDRLLMLKHLDISQNYIIAGSESIFSFSCKWEHLECLAMAQITAANEAFNFIMSSNHPSFLKSMRELTISLNQTPFASTLRYRVWGNLSKIHIYSWHSHFMKVFASIANAVETGIFPNLKKVGMYVIFPKYQNRNEQELVLFEALRQRNLPSALCKQVIQTVRRVTHKVIGDTLFQTNLSNFSFATAFNQQVDLVLKALKVDLPMTASQEQAVCEAVHQHYLSSLKSQPTSLEFFEILKTVLSESSGLLPISKGMLQGRNISVFLFSSEIMKGEAYRPEAQTKLIELNGFRL